jgi:hypothetical protein
LYGPANHGRAVEAGDPCVRESRPDRPAAAAHRVRDEAGGHVRTGRIARRHRLDIRAQATASCVFFDEVDSIIVTAAKFKPDQGCSLTQE